MPLPCRDHAANVSLPCRCRAVTRNRSRAATVPLQAIVDEDVPPKLKGKRVLALELGLLVADTKYRGEFEQRLKEVSGSTSTSQRRTEASDGTSHP